MVRNWMSLVGVLVFAACGEAVIDSPVFEQEGEISEAEAPLLGVDGQDAADRECHVILRDAEWKRGTTSWATDCTSGTCYYVFTGTVEVSTEAIAAGGKVGVLYQGAFETAWYEVTARGITGATEGFKKYRFDLKRNTLKAGLTASAMSRATIKLVPFVRFPSGGRLFDHNRVPGEYDTYVLNNAGQFGIAPAPLVCGAKKPMHAVVRFLGDRIEQQGALGAGGTVSVEYDFSRLTTCRGTHNGHPAWDITAHVRFLPSGQVASGTVRMNTMNGPQPFPFEAKIPEGTTSAEMWFKNYTGASSTCVAWDSNGGQNYRFEVLPRSLPKVSWAGDWGYSLNRTCEHVDGLPEPLKLDSYARERGCMAVDADVYVAGVTDANGVRPELIAAQVEYSIDGKELKREWLRFDKRVGNNYRYRWMLPRGELVYSKWATVKYAFRFSTDGITWYRVARAKGPGGGTQRTIVPDASW
ncbi:MAG: DUF6209 family protein [Myxococcales bacterium]